MVLESNSSKVELKSLKPEPGAIAETETSSYPVSNATHSSSSPVSVSSASTSASASASAVAQHSPSSSSSSSPSSPSTSSSSSTTSLSSSEASSPFTPQQATHQTNSQPAHCQSSQSQINPSVFHQNHPMLGLSAEEDAEFKRLVCSEDDIEESWPLQAGQSDKNSSNNDSDNNQTGRESQILEGSLNQVNSATKQESDQQAVQIANDAPADDTNNTPRPSAEPEPTIELRFLVRRREAGALIGKRGSNIKRLRDSFRSSMFSVPDTGNGPERVVCIATNESSLDAILVDFTQLLMEKSPENDEQIELKLLIHSSHAGSIIGIGGQSIKKLRNDSKAAIKIYEMCCPLSNERVCAIKAKPPVVVSTIKLVQAILSENPTKGTIKPYDALHFDLNLVDKYGGYLPDETVTDMLAGHHHYEPSLQFGAGRHHPHDAYSSSKHYSIWRSAEYRDPCDMISDGGREHHSSLAEGAGCPLEHQHHQVGAGCSELRLKQARGMANFHTEHNGRQQQQECNEELKGANLHNHMANFGGVLRSSRFHPYASSLVTRNQLDYAPCSVGAQTPVTAIQATLHRQQLASTSNHINPNSYSSQAASRLHCQQINLALAMQQRNNYMRPTSNVFLPNATERCRHARPCLCMFLPMTSELVGPAPPFVQLVKSFNHPRSAQAFGATNNNTNNTGNNTCNNNTSNSNNNKKKC